MFLHFHLDFSELKYYVRVKEVGISFGIYEFHDKTMCPMQEACS